MNKTINCTDSLMLASEKIHALYPDDLYGDACLGTASIKGIAYHPYYGYMLSFWEFHGNHCLSDFLTLERQV